MAQQGNVRDVVTITSLDLVSSLVENRLNVPFELLLMDRLFGPITNRFPVPPTASGFLTDMHEIEPPVVDPAIVGVRGVITGILHPQSDILESTIGQIWPR